MSKSHKRLIFEVDALQLSCDDSSGGCLCRDKGREATVAHFPAADRLNLLVSSEPHAVPQVRSLSGFMGNSRPTIWRRNSTVALEAST